jgi:cytochrome b
MVSASSAAAEPGGPGQAGEPVRVWSLPVRLFHWSTALLVVFSVTTAQIGGNALQWHFWSGYALLALVIFRVLWGLAGDRHARFAAFVRGPRAVLGYLRGQVPAGPGHNPVGALSVLAMLACLFVQAATGLFANDAIFNEGPLAKMVSGATSDLMTRIHKWNEFVLYGLVGLHLAAIAFYELVRRRRLVAPMVTGRRRGEHGPSTRDDAAMRLRALVLLLVAAGLVAYVVRL